MAQSKLPSRMISITLDRSETDSVRIRISGFCCMYSSRAILNRKEPGLSSRRKTFCLPISTSCRIVSPNSGSS